MTAGGLVPPRQVLPATYVSFGLAVAVRRLPDRRSPGRCCWLIGAASIIAGVLYTGGPRPYGYEGLGEVFVFLFFGARRGDRLLLRADPGAAVGGVRARRAGRPAGRRDPGRQQRARHRHRPPRRQAHAGGAAGPRARARRCTRRWSTAPSCSRRCRGSLGCAQRRGCCCVLVARRWRSTWSRTVRTRTDGPTLNGALARTGMLQLAFCVLLAAGDPAELMRLRVGPRPWRCASRCAPRTGRSRRAS